MFTMRLSALVLGLAIAGCAAVRQPEPSMLDNLEDMQVRVRLLQSEVAALRRTLSARDEEARREDGEMSVQQQLSALQSRLDELPSELSSLCPEASPASTLTTQCEGPDVQRVVVSGDKLVLGEVERVWMDPPGTFLEARVDAGSAGSSLQADEVVEFERDGNKWVRFNVAVEDEPVTVERQVTRYSKNTPVVTLRIQIGDVRETVEVTLVDPSDGDERLVLGRNYITDLALVDVARKHVQPAFRAPNQ